MKKLKEKLRKKSRNALGAMPDILPEEILKDPEVNSRRNRSEIRDRSPEKSSRGVYTQNTKKNDVDPEGIL